MVHDVLPSTPANYRAERIGISAVAAAIANLGQIWRETDTDDVGIDGQIEFVNSEGRATGNLLAVQVKSGESYFSHEDSSAYRFYPADKHKGYWERFPIPVLIVLHDPSKKLSYWADARQQLRGEKTPSSIAVPKNQTLETTSATKLFETAGVSHHAYIDQLDDVLKIMVLTRNENAGFHVSYLELFALGLTNIARWIYHGMDVALAIAGARLDRACSEFGVGVGETEHEFLFDFIKFLIAQNLARVDFAECLVDWLDREMQPHFAAALTSRGRALVRLIHDREADLVREEVLPDGGGRHVAQEAFFEMVAPSYWSRLDRILGFEDLMVERLKSS